jgi:hypothetical protein
MRQACDYVIAAATKLESLDWAKSELTNLLPNPEWCVVPEMKNELQARLRHHRLL